MTVATLLLTCLIFLVVGWTGGTYYVTALSVGGIVCVAASNGGATSQDLKTGFLVGATPRYQQIAILIGAAASALVLGPILLRLNNTGDRLCARRASRAGLARAGRARSLGARNAARTAGARTIAETYRVWQKTDNAAGRPGKYLVDDTGARRMAG